MNASIKKANRIIKGRIASTRALEFPPVHLNFHQCNKRDHRLQQMIEIRQEEPCKERTVVKPVRTIVCKLPHATSANGMPVTSPSI